MSNVFMNWIVPTVHVVCCVFLIIVVLLQTGKGADMGAVFGGGSQTLFGSSGAGNFLTHLTTGAAIAFMLTALILTYGASRAPSSSLFERLPAPSAPATPPPSPEAEGEVPPLPEPGAPQPATPPVTPPVDAK
jgi:preprotein translocase subunit SecG